MPASDAARELSRSRWAKVQDPAARRAATRPARISSAVSTLVENWPELTDAQVARLRALLQPPGGGQDAA
jgi:hypothetical protein